MNKICPVCYKSNPDEARFCLNCGSNLAQQQNQVQERNSQVTKYPNTSAVEQTDYSKVPPTVSLNYSAQNHSDDTNQADTPAPNQNMSTNPNTGYNQSTNQVYYQESNPDIPPFTNYRKDYGAGQSEFQSKPMTFEELPVYDNQGMQNTYNTNTSVSSEKKTKSKVPLIIIIVAVTVLVIAGGTAAFFMFILPEMNQLKVESVVNSSWEKDGDQYKMTFTSEQQKPFLAFCNVTDDEGKKSFDFVTINNGTGTVKSSNDKYTYSAYGYCEVEPVADNILTSIDTAYDFDTYSYTIGTEELYTCLVTFDFTLNTDKSGWLIYDSTNSKDKGIKLDNIAVVSNGKGKASIIITFDEKPDRSKFSAMFLPKFFVNCEAIEQGTDYKYISEFSVYEKVYTYIKETSYSGKQEISFDNKYNDGFVLYTSEIRSGGIADDIGKVEYSSSTIESGSATLTTYNSYKNSQSPSEPTYEVNVIGVIIPKSIGGARQEKATANTNTLDDYYSTADNSKADEINFRAIVNNYANGDRYYCKIASDGSYLEIDSNPGDYDDYTRYDALQYIKDINTALGFPDSLYKKMLKTRALDGTQHDENDRVKVSWTYHPDHGIEVLYEKKQ